MIQDQQMRLDHLIIGSDPLEQQQHHHHHPFMQINSVHPQYQSNYEDQAGKQNLQNYNSGSDILQQFDQPINYEMALNLFQGINSDEMDGNSLAMVRALEDRLKIIAMLDQNEKEITKKLNESSAIRRKMEQSRMKQSNLHNGDSPTRQGNGILENKSLVTSYVFQTGGPGGHHYSNDLKQSKQMPNSSLSASNLMRKKEPQLNMSAREQMKCTFHPEINKKSEKLAKRESGQGNYSVKYLYQDFLARKEKERGKIEHQHSEVKKAMDKCKIDTNSEKIVMRKIDKVFSSIISSVQDGDSISYENLGVLYQQIGLFRALEFQKSQDETSLYLNDRKKTDVIRLQAEMKFHEQSFRIMRISSEEGVSKKVAFDTIMVMMEKKIPISSCEGIISDILFNSLGIDASNMEPEARQSILLHYLDQSTLPEKSVSQNESWDISLLITNFRKLHDDKTNLMEWYGSKLNNLLSDSNIKSGGKKGETKSGPNQELKFHPIINKKSKQLDQFLQRSGSSTIGSSGQKGQLPVNQDSFTAELNFQEETRQNVGKSEKSRFEKLYDHSKYLELKKQEQKEILERDELNSYSFRPLLNQKSVAISKAQQQQQANGLFEQRINDGNSPSTGGEVIAKKLVHEKLYEKHKAMSDVKDEVRQLANHEREKQELQECSFKPQIKPFVPNYVRNEEGDSVVENIKGVQQQLERLKKARIVQQEKDSFFERQRLVLSQNASRFTETMPFSFDQNRSNLSASHHQRMAANSRKERDIIGNVDVNFSKGKKGRIIIYKGDNPDDLALNFTKIYSLNDEMRFTLRDMLANYISKIESENIQSVEQAVEENHFSNRSEKGGEGDETKNNQMTQSSEDASEVNNLPQQSENPIESEAQINQEEEDQQQIETVEQEINQND